MYSKELRNINCLILFIAYKVKISFKLKSQALNLAGMRRGPDFVNVSPKIRR